MSDGFLPMDLPKVAKAPTVIVNPKVFCSVCRSPEWWRCVPGQAPTSEMYAGSNIVALRADDGVDLVAYCWSCDPLLAKAAKPETAQ